MANWIHYRLFVLATNPEEINGIASRLKQPSSELLDWVAKRENSKPDEIKRDVTELVSFEPVTNLFYINESANKWRLFNNGFTRFRGIVDSHIFEISTESRMRCFCWNTTI